MDPSTVDDTGSPCCEVGKGAKQVLYIAVGLGVLAVQRLNVARHEWRAEQSHRHQA